MSDVLRVLPLSRSLLHLLLALEEGERHGYAVKKRVEELSGGRIHLTFGSALDLFGGTGVRYADCLAWNRKRER